MPATPDNETRGEIFCRTIWSAWILFTLGYISIYTCAALTVERWLAVTKPHLYRAIKPEQAIKAVVFVWIWGIAINITTLFRAKYIPGKQSCTWTSLSVANDELPWMDFALQTLLPVLVMIGLYIHILVTLRRLPVMSAEHRPTKKVTIVALAASTAIVLGWIPSRITFMMSKYGVVDPNSLLHYCLIMLSIANSCWNPALYGVYSSHFRKEYISIYKKVFHFKKPKQPSPMKGFTNIGLAATTTGSGSTNRSSSTQL